MSYLYSGRCHRQFRVPRVHRTKYHNKTNQLSVCMQDPDRARYRPLSTCAHRRAVRPCRRSPRARRAPILAVRPLSPYARCVVLEGQALVHLRTDGREGPHRSQQGRGAPPAAAGSVLLYVPALASAARAPTTVASAARPTSALASASSASAAFAAAARAPTTVATAA